MRILLLNHFPLTGSGSGVYTKNIADSLVKKGHQVCIIMPENQIISNDFNIKLHPVYFTNNVLIPNALPFNFPCFTTHPRSSINFFDLTKEQLKMYIDLFQKAIDEEIRTFKPDIVHAGHIWILPSLIHSIPLVITSHGTDLIGYEKNINFQKYAKQAIKNSNFIISISKDNQKKVQNIFNISKEKNILITNGYNSSKFYKKNYKKEDVLKQLGINKNYKKIVSFVGKFTQIKGIDILLKATSIYEDEDTLTVLAGDGELLDEMKNLVNKLNIKNVVFIGNQSQDMLNKIYNIADVSIVPSRNEAFGLVVIEALACGIPVIGSNTGGITEIINNQVGMLFKVDNYIELADKIKQVLDKKINFDSNFISEYAKKNFSQDKFTEKLIQVYKKAIKQTSL